MSLSDSQSVALLSLFDSLTETITVGWLVKSLKQKRHGGYQQPGRIIRDAISEGLIYVDSVDSDGDTFVGLTREGEEEWLEHFQED